jgi:hypothetical protein
MDADGFTVVKHAATPSTAFSSSAGTRRKKKAGVLQDFYKFQKQDQKLDRECVCVSRERAPLPCTRPPPLPPFSHSDLLNDVTTYI